MDCKANLCKAFMAAIKGFGDFYVTIHSFHPSSKSHNQGIIPGIHSLAPLSMTLLLASEAFYLHIDKEIANTFKCKSNSLGFVSVSKSKRVLGNLEENSAYLEYLTFICLV